MKCLINMFRGFCMALADSVPGVSGGTIAFVLGFYDKFILSLNNIIFGNKDERKTALIFLIKLGIGWIIGMILASFVLTSLFEKNIYEVSSLFLGFVVLSIPIMIKEEEKIFKDNTKNIIYAVIGIVIVTLITYFNPVNNGNYFDINNLSIGKAIYIFVAAMIAISAMVLPGISGSTLLLIFGLYMPIISAIKEFFHFNFDYFTVLFIFGLGILTGIISIIKLLKKLLEKHRSQVMYLVIGLMIGSLYAIVMGPTTIENVKEPLNFSNFNVIYFVIGLGVIYGLEKVKEIMKKNGVLNDEK